MSVRRQPARPACLPRRRPSSPLGPSRCSASAPSWRTPGPPRTATRRPAASINWPRTAPARARPAGPRARTAPTPVPPAPAWAATRRPPSFLAQRVRRRQEIPNRRPPGPARPAPAAGRSCPIDPPTGSSSLGRPPLRPVHRVRDRETAVAPGGTLALPSCVPVAANVTCQAAVPPSRARRWGTGRPRRGHAPPREAARPAAAAPASPGRPQPPRLASGTRRAG